MKAYPDICWFIWNEIQHLIRSELSGLEKNDLATFKMY